MAVNIVAYQQIIHQLNQTQTTLVAVSKTKPVEDILTLYNLGHRFFGENYVQEFVEKQASLPRDIEWHFIGHLQSNKVKYIVPFVHLIHGVDSFKLLQEINKQSLKHNTITNCLLQVHIAEEETKFGLDEHELDALLLGKEIQSLQNIAIKGLMGMASFSSDIAKVKTEFSKLQSLYQQYSTIQSPNISMQTLSMGMSGDFNLAIEQGSNMVRIGSLLFGERN